jgi:hypothetical protein
VGLAYHSDLKLVGGTGHYLNCRCEFAGGVFELLKSATLYPSLRDVQLGRRPTTNRGDEDETLRPIDSATGQTKPTLPVIGAKERDILKQHDDL